MTAYRPVVLIGFFALISTSVPSDAYEAHREHRVAVAVSSSEDRLRNRIVSLLNRELRALGDVVVTRQDPEYEIRIVAMAPTLVSGSSPSYAMSVVIAARSWTDEAMDDLMSSGLKEARSISLDFALEALMEGVEIRNDLADLPLKRGRSKPPSEAGTRLARRPRL